MSEHAPTDPLSPGECAPAASLPAGPPRYELCAEIAHGGMGVVYAARDTALDRDVAVKVLHTHFPAGSVPARRFVEEARITGQLQHPGIPAVHDLGTLPDGRPFLAMKLIKGDTLDALLKARPDPAHDRGRFVAAFAQLCQAVAYAHSRQVIHRDLKPANVMVGAFGEVQVMDWGLAKDLGRPQQAELVAPAALSRLPRSADPDATTDLHTSGLAPDSLTVTGQLMGTPAYMPPEQAHGDLDRVDRRADVFALGGILCAILTGRPPYAGKSGAEVMGKALAAELGEAMAGLDACGADPELVALCRRCLSADCAARPRDAAEVAQAVAGHLAAVEERARRVELDRVRAAEQRKRRRVQLTLAGAVVGLVVAVGLGALIASLWQRAEGEKERAEKAQGEAEKARDGEGGQRQIAETERDAANTARIELFKAKEKLAAVEYGRTMQVALQHWRDNNVAATLALLAGTRADLRGWEWRYVHRLCHSDLLTLRGHKNPVHSASFSPDGSRVLTGSDDGSARVWDATTGAEVLTLRGHLFGVRAASWSPDASRVVTGSDDNTARVWDARTGTPLFDLKGHSGSVSSATYSPDGSRVSTGSNDQTAKVWDAKTGAEVRTLPRNGC